VTVQGVLPLSWPPLPELRTLAVRTDRPAYPLLLTEDQLPRLYREVSLACCQRGCRLFR